MSPFVRADEQRFAVAEVVPRPQRGLRGVAIVACAIVVIVVDQTSAAIANAGLPYLAGITAASPDEASWIVKAFNAAYYAMILFSPWMMARFGRKKLMLAALTSFAATSLVLVVVGEYFLFVLLRFVQGAFLGCVFVPAGAALLHVAAHTGFEIRTTGIRFRIACRRHARNVRRVVFRR